MHTKIRIIVATTAMVSLLGMGAAFAQPTLTNPSGGTGNSEMDHSRMGGNQGAGSPHGGRLTGPTGGGPEVTHGNPPAQAPRPRN